MCFADLRGNPVDTAGLFSARIGGFTCAHQELLKVGFYSVCDYEGGNTLPIASACGSHGRVSKNGGRFSSRIRWAKCLFVANTNA